MRASLSLFTDRFWGGPCPLSRLWSWSWFQCLHSWMKFLSTAEFRPGVAATGTTLALVAWNSVIICSFVIIWETQYWVCIFCIISLISIISKAVLIFQLLSPFSSFSLVGRVGVDGERLSLRLLSSTLKGDTWSMTFYTIFRIYFTLLITSF